MYKTPKHILKHETIIPVSFHDTDSMGVVWHGNYIKFIEIAREALFDNINFGYEVMQKENLIFPITECNCKYRNFVSVLDKKVKVVAMLSEYEGKICIHYEVYSEATNKLCAYGYTHQVIVKSDTKELLYENPECFKKALEAAIKVNQ